MKKKLIPLLLTAIALVMPLNTYAAETIPPVAVNTNIISPAWIYSESYSLTKTYSSANNIPTSVYYEYYKSTTYGWMRGTLYLKSYTTDKKGKVTATYTGTLYSGPL